MKQCLPVAQQVLHESVNVANNITTRDPSKSREMKRSQLDASLSEKASNSTGVLVREMRQFPVLIRCLVVYCVAEHDVSGIITYRINLRRQEDKSRNSK